MARFRSSAPGLVLLALALCALWASPSVQTAFAEAGDAEAKSGTDLKTMVASHALAVAAVVLVTSTVVSKQEPPPAPPAQVPVEKRSDFTRVLVLGSALSLISGMVNAVAIITMGGTVSHHTGNASHAGRLAGTDGQRFAELIVAYGVGAAVCGFRKSNGENAMIGKASPALLGSAIAVAGGAIIHWASGRSLLALPILAFSQGIHNGVTSKFSSMPYRSTHMTGTLTDAGAAIGGWLRSKVYGDAPPPAEKTFFLLASLLCFSFGGVLAKMGTDKYGSLAALPPAAVLAVMALGVLPMPPADKKA